MSRPTLLLLVSEDWYLVSHRLPLVKGAVAAGYKVIVATRVRQHGELIRATGAEVIPLRLNREGRSPLGELGTLWELIGLYRKIRPMVAHHVAMKPILYGSIAARLAGTPRVVNAFAGLGYAFTGQSAGRRLFGSVFGALLRLVIRGSRSIALVQNEDDRASLVARQIVTSARTRLIRGSGVELDRFRPAAEPAGTPLVILPARLLYDKGVAEFVAAAAELKGAGVAARFALVGGEDLANPAGVERATVDRWVAEGLVEWWGHRVDMEAVLGQAAVVCLPSYREGLPKALLEAMASGRPIVTTDAPGCREVVRSGENGLLVPVRDSKAVAVALRTLLDDRELRARMGAAGRHRAETEFDARLVVASTIGLYSEPFP